MPKLYGPMRLMRFLDALGHLDFVFEPKIDGFGAPAYCVAITASWCRAMATHSSRDGDSHEKSPTRFARVTPSLIYRCGHRERHPPFGDGAGALEA
jgi:hypothetical protein